jgi:hypothetical protein
MSGWPNVDFRGTKSLGQRLAGAFRALAISFTLSLIGAAIDFIIFALSGGLILLTASCTGPLILYWRE